MILLKEGNKKPLFSISISKRLGNSETYLFSLCIKVIFPISPDGFMFEFGIILRRERLEPQPSG